FDVIHYHNMSLIGLNALTFGNAIKLFTFHDYWPVCPMHTLWKYNREVCTKRACVSCQIFGKRPVQWWRYSGMVNKALSHVDAFISPSVFTKQKYHELGLDVPIIHIPNFLPSAESCRDFVEDDYSIHQRPYFLFVGRLEKIKGVQNLITVFRKYSNADLIVAGDGEYGHTLRELAADVPNVRFLGWVSQGELRSLYRGATAVLVPSIWYEVFGMIVIEAFAMRVPVVVNNAGALPELVNQSGGGFVYDNDDGLISCMEKLRLNPDQRQMLGAKGFQAYEKYWREDRYITQYYQLIQDVAARKNLKHPTVLENLVS
ncbi:MAG: glycosyltransferase family 4 protein, partial [Acidobacteriota bacterium]